MNLRYHATLGAALVATSSAWTSPSLLSMKRSVHHGINREQPFLIHRGFSTGNGVSTTTTSLASALAAPSSSDANTAGQPVATGSIVNVFRGGLVAARIIDDDLSKVNVSLEVDIPEVVDPSLSVPDEMKSKKKSSEDALGMQNKNQ